MRAAGVIALFGAERANDGQAIRLLRQLRQMFAESQAGDAGRDFLKGAAVGVTGLHIPGIRLAGAAAHPQQDAMPAAAWIIGEFLGQRRNPGRAARPNKTKAEAQMTQEVAALDGACSM